MKIILLTVFLILPYIFHEPIKAYMSFEIDWKIASYVCNFMFVNLELVSFGTVDFGTCWKLCPDYGSQTLDLQLWLRIRPVQIHDFVLSLSLFGMKQWLWKNRTFQLDLFRQQSLWQWGLIWGIWELIKTWCYL